MTDPWNVDALDLDAYLARTGAPVEPPSTAALERLQVAHALTFSFDNLDVLLRTHPGVALDQVAGKFVGRGRGGYCFEHSTLFGAVLERLGYAVTRHLGRVGSPELAPRTHMVLVAELEGQDWLVDPGFGRPPLGPVPLTDGAEVSYAGWRHRLRRVPEGSGQAWALDMWGTDGWELQHTTDLLPVRPVDVAMGHHWTSTQPQSHFATSLMLIRRGLDPDGGSILTTLSLDGLSVRRPDRPTEHRDVDDVDVAEVMATLTGGLRADEISALQRVVSALRTARSR